MSKVSQPWKHWQRIGFRLAFPLLSLTTIIPWQLNLFFAYSTVQTKGFDLAALYKPLTPIFYWLDTHFFHLGYDPKIHEGFPQDNHFAAVFYLAIFVFSIISCLIWGIADRHRNNYDRFYFWFCLYLRYTLAITIIGYGVDKIIPTQMPWPNIATMLTAYGDLSRFNVLWNFMGISPGYMAFTGAFEIVAGLLLLNKRTLLLGYLLLLTILANVVALNWFYNVPVKMLSSQLLLYNLFLLAPYSTGLYQFFIIHVSNNPIFSHREFEARWKNKSLGSVLVIIPLLLLTLTAIGVYRRYQKQQIGLKKEELYIVDTFQTTDTSTSLASTNLKWKYLLSTNQQVVIESMDNHQEWYSCDTNRLANSITLYNYSDRKISDTLRYIVNGNSLSLSGYWKKNAIKITLHRMPIDSLAVNKEKTRLIGD